MFFHYYDISPGIIGIIIWVIISFLFKKRKKKKNPPNDQIVTEGDVIIDKELQFEQLSGVLDPQAPFNFHYDEEFIEYDENIKLSNLPGVVICNTVKGKDIPFAEHEPIWHYRNLDKDHYDLAINHLNKLK